MTHIMLDLETFGTRAGSVIRSIGAVVFDPNGAELGAEFYRNIDRASCESVGLTTDKSTEDWWAKQSKEAQDSLLEDQLPLGQVVSDFNQWFVHQCGTKVWCQGANFDSVLWEAAVAAAGHRVPWRFWCVRDTRTVYEMFRFDASALKREGTYHNALADAKHQAGCVQTAVRNYEYEISKRRDGHANQ